MARVAVTTVCDPPFFESDDRLSRRHEPLAAYESQPSWDGIRRGARSSTLANFQTELDLKPIRRVVSGARALFGFGVGEAGRAGGPDGAVVRVVVERCVGEGIDRDLPQVAVADQLFNARGLAAQPARRRENQRGAHSATAPAARLDTPRLRCRAFSRRPACRRGFRRPQEPFEPESATQR